ncbi:MAG: pyruvate:ferredoxin (flavodoxin) oxidoreductase [Clostridia bacterium]|nr:pyruvate:ferredoxin (flavodoxin) oxidoreductase [Clostridia bacterium]
MKKITMDGNAAASHVSYAFSELAIIYPITPSTPMAEQADEWSSAHKPNLFGVTPKVVQMQSESGVAGAMHGALTCGALATTYTCSQGLLLMLPDMYKIAGELLPTVFHVSARALAAHALSIFGDHQDVMAARQTGFALLASASVQETMDLALVAHLATLKTSVPFLHFFDGFRTSHELSKIDMIEYEEMKPLVDQVDIDKFRARALSPDHPRQRGTAQNPDTYFQNREAANNYYLSTPKTVQEIMDKVAQITGRAYRLFDYYGDQKAEYVAVIVGSGGYTMQETVDTLNAEGKKTGVIQVRLYRPFDVTAFCEAIPKSCQKLAVLDRTKESGSLGEPLYLDVCAALAEKGLSHIRVVGGRYGLGLKEFTPSMCRAVFENLESAQPKNHFTVGIYDDLTQTSLDCSAPFPIIHKDRVSCKFYGLGSDGTVGANKNSIKIIGDHTDLFVQGYFVYDSKKSGGITVSHLRFGNTPIRSAYLIDNADFIACHNPSYVTRYDMLSDLKEGGTVLINCPCKDENELNAYLPPLFKQKLAEKHASLYTIDATTIANEVGLRGRTSTIMQAAFFLLNPKVMPYEKAISYLKEELQKKFAKKGEDVIKSNITAIDMTKERVKKIDYPESWKTTIEGKHMLPTPNDEYFRTFIHPILSLQGDKLPVSAFEADGSVPTGTTRLEKHGAAYLLPEWIPQNCIQCNQCSFVCPHACIRPFVLDENVDKPEHFITKPATGLQNAHFRIQVAPHDCMGCGVCANVCPAKEKALVMRKATDLLPKEGRNWEFAENVKQADTSLFKRNTVKGSQFFQPLFEFSYACSGCGETSYIKVLTQLFGEKMIIANATGCSSIYGGSSPTCPYTKNADGKGPAWANSLFEDNAEFGYGMRLALDTDKSVWIVGGDGWAYDIGYGGLDHVLASGANVNVLVLDSEVYSNTGGQSSKATPMGATARFATAGKRIKKKDMGMMAITYGYVYVAQVSMGANKQQFLNALTEAESYNGPSLIIAYSPCIAHGAPMSKSMDEEKLAVDSGYWQLYRYNPALKAENKKPFILDSKAPTAPFQDFLMGENRFASLKKAAPEIADELFKKAEEEACSRRALYEKLAEIL